MPCIPRGLALPDLLSTTKSLDPFAVLEDYALALPFVRLSISSCATRFGFSKGKDTGASQTL